MSVKPRRRQRFRSLAEALIKILWAVLGDKRRWWRLMIVSYIWPEIQRSMLWGPAPQVVGFRTQTWKTATERRSGETPSALPWSSARSLGVRSGH